MRDASKRARARAALAAIVFALASLVSWPALAHGGRTAYVAIEEIAEGSVTVRVRSGAADGIRIDPPAGCTPSDVGFTCADGLAKKTLEVTGLGAVVSDAVVSVTYRDGRTDTQLLRAGQSSWQLAEHTGSGVFARYVLGGVRHVLSGADHLLFLLGLVVALRRPRAVLLAESAFTLSHSIAFTALALGWISVPAAPAEAAIALSLVLLALDMDRKGTEALTTRAGSAMALVFGGVHGLGFAGGLQEAGVPKGTALPALAGFALGVELGQVLFLAFCLTVVALATRTRLAPRIGVIASYGVGIPGAFWLWERALPLVRTLGF